MFLRFLKNEMSRLFGSPSFLIIFISLSLLVIVDGIIGIKQYYENLDLTLSTIPVNENGVFADFPWLQINTLYNTWIGGKPNGVLTLLFFFLMPAYCVIPFSHSYIDEVKSGYTKLMVTKIGKYKYFLGKYISGFVSGFVIVALPMILSLCLVACFVPAYTPDVLFKLYFQVDITSLLGNIYYTHPNVCLFLIIIVTSSFSGLFATVPLAVSLFVKNKFIALFAPYFVLLFIVYSLERAFAFRIYVSASILDYIRPTQFGGNEKLWIFLFEMFILFALTFFTVIIGGGKKDVY